MRGWWQKSARVPRYLAAAATRAQHVSRTGGVRVSIHQRCTSPGASGAGSGGASVAAVAAVRAARATGAPRRSRAVAAAQRMHSGGVQPASASVQRCMATARVRVSLLLA
jgi:hypothetical protein